MEIAASTRHVIEHMRKEVHDRGSGGIDESGDGLKDAADGHAKRVTGVRLGEDGKAITVTGGDGRGDTGHDHDGEVRPRRRRNWCANVVPVIPGMVRSVRSRSMPAGSATNASSASSGAV